MGSRTGRRTSPSRYGSCLPAASRPQYASFRRSVSVPSSASAPAGAANGPVPAAPRAIAVCGAARCARNGPNGARRSNRTVLGSTACTLRIAAGSAKSARYADPRVVIPRSKLATTAAASSALPSWNRTPSRRANVQDAPSLVICHPDASAGVIRDVAGSTSTSVSKIWRVATSDASSFHGSSEAASAAMATRRVPPAIAGVGEGVATLGLSVHPPSTTQMARSNTAEERIR